MKTKIFSLFIIYLLFSISAESQNYTLKFSGSNYARVTTTLPNTLTIELWFRTSVTSTAMCLVGFTDFDVSGSPSNLTPSIAMNASGQIRAEYWTGAYTRNIVSGTAYNDGKWHHIAYTGTSNSLILYIDGVQIGSNTGTFSIDNSIFDRLFFATGYSDNARLGGGNNWYYFEGDLDEIRIWTSVRTQAEINDYMYKELTGNETNLMAYYKMSNGSGSTLNDDQALSNYDATLFNSPSWLPSGAFSGSRNCLYFDGSNDHVSANVNYSAIGYGDFTIEGWICPSALAGDYRMIVADENLDNFQFNLTDGGTSAKMQFYTNGNANKIESDVLSWTLNQWYHVAVVRSSGVITFYRDGVACGSGTRNLSIWSSHNIYVGRRPYGLYNHPFNGKIDEIRIWNTARTAEQLKENMTKTLTGTESGLLLYYRFDYGLAGGTNTGITSAYDMTSNSYDGALTNFSLSGSSSNWVSSSAFNTWIGSEGTLWSTAGNWSSGSAPGSTDNIGVYDYTNGNDPIIGTATTVNNLVIGSGASLSVGEGYSLTVSGNLHNNGTLSVESNGLGASATGSLITSGTNTYGTSCTTIVKRFVDGGSGGGGYIHFVSPPISNATGANLWGGNLGNLKPYYYNEATSSWVHVPTSASLTSGVGYYAAYNQDKTLNFSGTLNTGNINVPVTRSGASYTGFNLIGNPYPSRLNASAFITDGDNTEINGALYFWVDDHGHVSGYTIADYATWNLAGSNTGAAATGGGSTTVPNQYVESCQGFWVYATSAGTLTFKNSHRVHTAPATFYTTEPVIKNRIWLNMKDISSGVNNNILVASIEDATIEYDRLYDAPKMRGNQNIAFYSLIPNDEKEYVIQGIPPVNDKTAVSLGYFTNLNGNFTISIDSLDNFPDDMTVILEDLTTQTRTNIRKLDYTFTSNQGEFNNRFVLHILNESVSTKDSPMEISPKVRQDGNTIYIYPDKNEAIEFNLYNLSGQLIKNILVKDEKLIHVRVNDLDSGVYLYQLKSGEMTENGKILIR